MVFSSWFYFTLCLWLLFLAFCALLGVFFKGWKPWKKGLKRNVPFYIGFFILFGSSFEDMPTPDFVWGGVAFMFPSINYREAQVTYGGGTITICF